METLTAINTRRSVRKFNNKPVSDEVIEKILRAAMQAPSAGNEQPWHFIVVKDKEVLKQLAAAYSSYKMCDKAQLAMVCCGDLGLAKHGEFWIQDVAAATQNILLAVRDEELGAVWLGVHPREERIEKINNILKIPENIVPLDIIAIGYSDVEQEYIDRYQKERIHYDAW
jgi:nitroreductase